MFTRQIFKYALSNFTHFLNRAVKAMKVENDTIEAHVARKLSQFIDG